MTVYTLYYKLEHCYSIKYINKIILYYIVFSSHGQTIFEQLRRQLSFILPDTCWSAACILLKIPISSSIKKIVITDIRDTIQLIIYRVAKLELGLSQYIMVALIRFLLRVTPFIIMGELCETWVDGSCTVLLNLLIVLQC